MNEVKVTGCIDCPFYHDGQDYEYAHYCKHPDSKQKTSQFEAEPKIKLANKEVTYELMGTYIIEFPITPDWCPLKKESLTLIYQET